MLSSFEEFEEKVRIGQKDYFRSEKKKRKKYYKQQARPRQRYTLYQQDQNCHICLQFVSMEEASVDHIDPHGSRRNMSNMKLAHRKCNQVRNRGSLWDMFQLGLYLGRKSNG